jgi:hypothetical protein
MTRANEDHERMHTIRSSLDTEIIMRGIPDQVSTAIATRHISENERELDTSRMRAMLRNT